MNPPEAPIGVDSLGRYRWSAADGEARIVVSTRADGAADGLPVDAATSVDAADAAAVDVAPVDADAAAVDVAAPVDAAPSETPPGESKAHIESLARGGLLKVVGGLSNGVFTFLLALVVTHSLGAGGFGAFSAALALFTILESATALGTDVGLVRTISRQLASRHASDVRTTLRVAYVPVAALTVLAAVAMFVFAHPLAVVFADRPQYVEAVTRYLHWLALFLPLSVLFDTSVAITRGLGTMTPDVLLDKVLKTGLQLALVALLALTGIGVVGLSLAWGIPLAVCFVFGLFWMRKLLRRAERRARRNGSDGEPARDRHLVAREFWSFSAPRALSSIFKVCIDRIAILLVAALAGTVQSGIYTGALRFLAAGQFASLAVMQTMAPKISAMLASKRMRDAGSVYQISSAWSLMLTWPVYLTLAGFAPLVLRVLGAEFVAGHTAMVIVSGAMLLSTAIGPVDVVLLMGGKSSWNLLNTVVALTVNIVLNIVLIAHFHMGLEGAAIAWFVSVALNNLMPLAQVWRFLRLHPFGKGFPRAVLAATVSFGGVGLAVRALMGTTLPALLVYALIAGPLYLLFLWRFREALELTSLKGVLRGRAARGHAV
jgi:O-antigen/teichoic acid export membrane protein